MPVQEHTKVIGLRGLVRAMKVYDERVLAAMKVINLHAAERVAARERQLAPKRRGTLAGTVKPKALTYSAIVLVGGSAAPYANPIVYGWPARNIEKQPFPYDALDAERETVKAEYEAAVTELAHRTFHGVEPD